MKIKILAKEVEIIFVDYVDFGSPLYGQIDHVNDIIKLHKNMSMQNKKVTLTHEVLHSIFEQLGLNEEHDNELLIKSLSTSLIQLLESNLELLSFFCLRQSTSSDGF